MIFVSLGTHPQPFDRLVREIGSLVDRKVIREKVFIQTGYTTYSHPKIETKNFLSIEEFEKNVEKCSIFVTHAGEGNIGLGLQLGKPMIVVPRLQKHGEHTNDHQLELARAVEKKQYGPVILNVKELEKIIPKIKAPAPDSETSFFPEVFARIFEEQKIVPNTAKQMVSTKFTKPRSASIVVATLNGGEPLIKAVNGMLLQSFSGKYEVVIVDDGSFDGVTPGLLKKHFSNHPNIKLIFLPRSGVAKARNAGIAAAKYDVIINMDHDCLPEKDWLKVMMSGFDAPDVGAVSAYGHYGGTSTGFRRDVLQHLRGYDEEYFYYREDTDLSFRIMELGFRYNKVKGARYTEDRTLVTPKGIGKIIKYTIQRMNYHRNDVQLHKKHKTPLCNDFLHVRGTFFVDPVFDFKVVTGLWEDDSKAPEISSPRGMTFMSGKGSLRLGMVILVGLAYAFAMKWARLAGSIKHKHFLV